MDCIFEYWINMNSLFALLNNCLTELIMKIDNKHVVILIKVRFRDFCILSLSESSQ